MHATQQLPHAPADARCPNCSLINACLPDVVGQRGRLQKLQIALFVPQPLAQGREEQINA
jgi:hypothetical protein